MRNTMVVAVNADTGALSSSASAIVLGGISVGAVCSSRSLSGLVQRSGGGYMIGSHQPFGDSQRSD